MGDKPNPIITLTSDFGVRDGYVAAMKGVILRICRGATIIDVCHDVPPQDVSHAAFVLGSTYPYFFRETTHVAVVDPGVGTERRPLLLETPAGRFIAPDKGLLTYVLMAHGGVPGPPASSHGECFLRPVVAGVPESCRAYVLDRDAYWLSPVSSTFHGRDLFAPVAAHLAAGTTLGELGTPTDAVTYLYVPRPTRRGRAMEGRVIHADRFGNLVTNIGQNDLPDRDLVIEVEGHTVKGLSRSYLDRPGLLALVGSHGYLEVSESLGSAGKTLGAGVGSRVVVLGE